MNPMRAYLLSQLDGTGAFLRCDRGGALYVTNLPVRLENWCDTACAIEENGFKVEQRGALLAITPEPLWKARFEGWAQGRCGESELTRLFRQRAASESCAEEMRAWFDGIKRLDLHGGAEVYEREVRQAAAVALRKQCGAYLYACGLCLDLQREDIVC